MADTFITTPVQVRFADIDLAGHVHNAVYLHYFELGRMDLLGRFIAKDHDWARTGLILARNEVDHRRPVHLGDPVEVRTWCARTGDRSFDLHYEVRHAKDGAVFAEGRSVMVCFDHAEKRSVPLPDAWRMALARFMPQAAP